MLLGNFIISSTCSLSSLLLHFSYILSVNPEPHFTEISTAPLVCVQVTLSETTMGRKRYFSCYFPLISRAASARLLWNTLQSFQYFRPHQRTIKCHHLAGFSSLIVLSPPESSDIFHTKTGYTLLQQPLSILILFPSVRERVNSLLYMNIYVKVCK